MRRRELMVNKTINLNRTILYTATSRVDPYATDVFGANIILNKYSDETGEGIIYFDSDVTSIGDQAFYNKTNLRTITIPLKVSTIGVSAFEKCINLALISMPESLTSIGNKSFYNCEKLSNVVIPRKVTTIGDYAFYNCKSLNYINIPKSMQYIGNAPFVNSSLYELYIEDLYYWCKIDFNGELSNPMRYATIIYIGGDVVSDITLPNVIIKDYAFCGLSCNSVTIPE